MATRWIICISVCLLSGAVATTQAAGDADSGKTKSLVCSGCHGADGNSINPIWPKLAGQHEVYLVKSIKDFRSGARSNPMMAPMVANLSDQDIDDLAAYFSSQKQN